jgi:hypothetical protein
MAKRSNQLSKGGAGGGLGSKALGKTTQYFTGQPSQRVSPKGVSQFGESIGNHATDSAKVLRGGVEATRIGMMGGMGAVKLGNEVALNVGGGGPGTGRVLLGQSGTNQQYGPAAGKPAPQGKDILNEFGPNIPGRK